jgi:hypothetical protein
MTALFSLLLALMITIIGNAVYMVVKKNVPLPQEISLGFNELLTNTYEAEHVPVFLVDKNDGDKVFLYDIPGSNAGEI